MHHVLQFRGRHLVTPSHNFQHVLVPPSTIQVLCSRRDHKPREPDIGTTSPARSIRPRRTKSGQRRYHLSRPIEFGGTSSKSLARWLISPPKISIIEITKIPVAVIIIALWPSKAKRIAAHRIMNSLTKMQNGSEPTRANPPNPNNAPEAGNALKTPWIWSSSIVGVSVTILSLLTAIASFHVTAS